MAPIIEEDSVLSDRMTESLFRFTLTSMQTAGKSDTMNHISHAPVRNDTSELIRTDLPQVVMDGLPLGHTLSIIGKLEMMCDIVRALAFLHSKGYMHCDIKSLNFLVTEVLIATFLSSHAF